MGKGTNSKMPPLELNDPEKIREFLSQVSLTGKGFTTECLLVDVFESGLDYPDFLRADGEDSTAVYKGVGHAWAKYHIRQGKRVFMVYGGEGESRKTHFTETP